MNFDIDRYLTLVAPLDDSDIDYENFVTNPLDDDTLRCLRYMHDIEFHTTCYLRDLLVSSAHDEPNGRSRIAVTRRRVGRERLTTLAMMIGSAITDNVVTVALAWEAVNEWTTQAGYVQLAKRSGHPVLGELLQRIAKQEGRHIDFYASQASRRLEASRSARRLTRFALRRAWRPVGSGVMPEVETDHLIAHLFGGDDGQSMAEGIDRRLSRLPGLDALGLVSSARRDAVGVAA